MKYDYYGITDKGKVRENNEDKFYIEKLSDNEFVFAVADGMGGHQAGEIASETAINILSENIKRINRGDISQNIGTIINNINDTLLQMSDDNSDYWGLGTTLTVLYIKDDKGYLGHVGDSRLYKYYRKKLIQISEDHSFVAKLVKDKIISEKEAKTHPKRNLLLQSLGMLYGKMIPQIKGPFEIKHNEKYLLCSDGVHGFIEDNVIVKGLMKKTPEEAAKYLLNAALKEGGPDNITIIVIYTNKTKKTTKTKEFQKLLEKAIKRS